MEEHRWYAIQTTAGHENKVRSLIERRIQEDPRPEEERPIRRALVPVQDVVEIKNGKKVTVERKIYPGYVLVEMVMNQETIHTINSIQGVIKFVGTSRLPQPLRQDEVNRLLGIEEPVAAEEPQLEIPFLIGQVVDRRGAVLGLQRDRRGSDPRQGEGARGRVALRTPDLGRARFSAAEGALTHADGRGRPPATTRDTRGSSRGTVSERRGDVWRSRSSPW
jgi:transcriptional antiterminator NusG